MLKALPCIGARRERRLCNAQRHARARTPFIQASTAAIFATTEAFLTRMIRFKRAERPVHPLMKPPRFGQENSGEAF